MPGPNWLAGMSQTITVEHPLDRHVQTEQNGHRASTAVGHCEIGGTGSGCSPPSGVSGPEPDSRYKAGTSEPLPSYRREPQVYVNDYKGEPWAPEVAGKTPGHLESFHWTSPHSDPSTKHSPSARMKEHGRVPGKLVKEIPYLLSHYIVYKGLDSRTERLYDVHQWISVFRDSTLDDLGVPYNASWMWSEIGQKALMEKAKALFERLDIGIRNRSEFKGRVLQTDVAQFMNRLLQAWKPESLEQQKTMEYRSFQLQPGTMVSVHIDKLITLGAASGMAEKESPYSQATQLLLSIQMSPMRQWPRDHIGRQRADALFVKCRTLVNQCKMEDLDRIGGELERVEDKLPIPYTEWRDQETNYPLAFQGEVHAVEVASRARHAAPQPNPSITESAVEERTLKALLEKLADKVSGFEAQQLQVSSMVSEGLRRQDDRINDLASRVRQPGGPPFTDNHNWVRSPGRNRNQSSNGNYRGRPDFPSTDTNRRGPPSPRPQGDVRLNRPPRDDAYFAKRYCHAWLDGKDCVRPACRFQHQVVSGVSMPDCPRKDMNGNLVQSQSN